MKLPRVSGIKVVKALARAGYTAVRQTGSHIILVRPGFASLSVPNHRELSPGTLRSIIDEAEMTVEEFSRWLK